MMMIMEIRVIILKGDAIMAVYHLKIANSLSILLPGPCFCVSTYDLNMVLIAISASYLIGSCLKFILAWAESIMKYLRIF